MDHIKNFFVRYKKHWKYVSVIVIIFLVFFAALSQPPKQFPQPGTFSISEGATLDVIASDLEARAFIRSAAFFKTIVRVAFFDTDGNGAIAGDYLFEKPLHVFTLAKRIVDGTFSTELVRVTIPEGLNKYEIADLLEKYIVNFDTQTFTSIAPEGYLFPDTYFFAPFSSPDTIVRAMKNNFGKKIGDLLLRIEDSPYSLEEIVTMASIIETEARETETRRIISGILWRRIERGMPLQVDVSFKYINGKNSSNLTLDDLDIDSPYNTYRYAGLPPTPIANPGLDALEAALNPTDTEFVYFLSDRRGMMHYAVTFDEHKRNKQKYIR